MSRFEQTDGLRSFAAKHHRALHISAWILWIFPFLLLVLSHNETEGNLFLKTPVPLIFLFFALVAALNGLGDAGELASHKRRIRPIEYFQKILPLPILIFLLLGMVYVDGLGFGKNLVIYIIVYMLCLNIKSLYDLVSANREVVTCREMKELERKTDEAGLSYYEMMENAGTEAFGYICEEEMDVLEDLLIFCGNGNNGGDGFVVARKAKEYGCQVTVVLACGMPKTADAITNFEKIRDQVRVLIPENDAELSELLDQCSHINSNEKLNLLYRLRRRLHNLDRQINDEDYIIVDAIFGTGFHGKPEGIPKRSIDYMNNLKGVNRIYALDVPSGLPGDEMDETKEYFDAVYADCAITFHAKKPVHKNRGPEVSSHMKKVIVADIGITTTLERDLFFGDDDPRSADQRMK